MNASYRKAGRSCCSCPLSRRQFLAGCAAGLGTTLAGPALWTEDAVVKSESDKSRKVRVRLVWNYAPSTGPIWPNIGYNFEARKKWLLSRLIVGCPDIELFPVDVQNSEEAEKILHHDKDVDGYLVYFLGCEWSMAPNVIAASGKPMLLVDDLYGGSGTFLSAYAGARRKGRKVAGISTSRFQEVLEAINCFRILQQPGATIDDFLIAAESSRHRNTKSIVVKENYDPVQNLNIAECRQKLKASTILWVGTDFGEDKQRIEEIFGTKVLLIGFEELNEAYQKADTEAARKQAQRWIEGALKVVEPSKEEIEKSGAMYLAMRELMQKHNAQAININCLDGFYEGHIKGYPCLGYRQLNDDGFVGACWGYGGDAITMLVGGYLAGRPGFISDPVIDTSKRQIIYAHCVGPTRVFGPKGPANPYLIRSHSEDRQGAAIQAILPTGYLTTTIYFRPDCKQVLMHQGVTVDNIDEDKACRTKLAVEVKGDIEKLMLQWDQWGWHRVTFYGDLKKPVQKLAEALGVEAIEEA